MDNKLVICKKCIKEFSTEPYTSPFQYRGLFINYSVPDNYKCPICNEVLYRTQTTMDEIKTLYKISHDNEFLNAMIELKEKDIIEYNIKMSQFRASIAQKESAQKVSDNERSKPKCPTCGSTNLHQISATSKTINTALFGIFGNKRKKQFHCNNCGYEW